MRAFALIVAITWTGLWFTPDQEGQRLLKRGEFLEAARSFRDPMWKGIALYRAGEFEEAAQVFGRLDSPEGAFNQGNARLMHGQYEEAAHCYDLALAERPEWLEAQENRALALARAKMNEQKGGDMGDQKIGADKIVFDKDKSNDGQETDVEGAKPLSDHEIQALWLRRVQTKPAEFLKAKFAYQEAARGAEGDQ